MHKMEDLTREETENLQKYFLKTIKNKSGESAKTISEAITIIGSKDEFLRIKRRFNKSEERQEVIRKFRENNNIKIRTYNTTSNNFGPKKGTIFKYNIALNDIITDIENNQPNVKFLKKRKLNNSFKNWLVEKEFIIQIKENRTNIFKLGPKCFDNTNRIEDYLIESQRERREAKENK